MKKVFLYIVTLVAAVACYPVEVENDLSTLITETISGNYGPFTKATIADADASFKWSARDQIAVHVSDGKYYTTNELATGGNINAEFSVTYPEGKSRDAFAIFPASIVIATAANYGQSGATLDVTLPPSYTLAQVSGETGETSPCPMIATNDPAVSGWEFYQLCSLLRLTVSNIPATAKRLEIDFDGKKVWGDFSIANPIPGESVISLPANPTEADKTQDIITITKDGTDAVLGATSLVLNIPLPVGDYSKITVIAYDEISGGNTVSAGNVSFSYSASRTKAVKKSTSLRDQSTFTFTFKDKATGTNLGGLRFVRIFSGQNKLYNGSTTFGPYTVSRATGETENLANPVLATLKFGSDDGDQLAFQVIDENGKVYAGIYDAPAGGFIMGEYDLTVEVYFYTFTVETNGKKVYFSPGDLGVDGSVYSFTEPFETWGWGKKDATKRVWFTEGEVRILDVNNGPEIYGIKWRDVKRSSTKIADSPYPYEWNNIVRRTNMNSGVSPYYRVTVYDPILLSNHVNCLLLPPDETLSTDIGDDITAGTVTNYAKYLGKGFVLLISTGNASGSWSWTSTDPKEGWYWVSYNTQNRFYFIFKNNTTTPYVDWSSAGYKMRARFVRDVPNN